MQSIPRYLENLESRTFLSVSVNNGVLTVIGTPEADQIVIRYVQPKPILVQPLVIIDPPILPIPVTPNYVVSVNGDITLFPAADVKSVYVAAGAGDDVIDLGGSQIYTGGPGPIPITPVLDIPIYLYDDSVPVDAVIYCGPGNDLAIGGRSNDWMRGGLGDDTLRGRWGNDVLHGAAGNDSLEGNVGDDTLQGGTGDDTLFGGPGNDAILGGQGSDHFFFLDPASTLAVRSDDTAAEILDFTPGIDVNDGPRIEIYPL